MAETAPKGAGTSPMLQYGRGRQDGPRAPDDDDDDDDRTTTTTTPTTHHRCCNTPSTYMQALLLLYSEAAIYTLTG